MLGRIKKLVATVIIAATLVVTMGTGASAATTGINVRAKASTSSKVITKIYSGSSVKVLSSSGHWLKVRVNNKVGYIYSSSITKSSSTTTTTKSTTTVTTKKLYSPSYFRRAGVIKWNGWKWTWYSQKVLPGKGLKIPGRHVDSNGYVCDKNGYICLASTSRPKGTIVSTPFGKKGKVYDSGCAKGVMDVYVNW